MSENDDEPSEGRQSQSRARRTRDRAGGRRAAAQRRPPDRTFSDRMLARVLSRLGGRSEWRDGGTVPAGRAGSLRLSYRLLLAGAGAGPVESRPRLDGEMRRGPEGLAQDRSHLPVIIMKRLALVSGAVLLAGAALLNAQKAKPAGGIAGNGTLIIGAYPKQFWIIDEATEKTVGSIPFQSGIPRRTALSRDRKRFYTIEAAMEKVELLGI